MHYYFAVVLKFTIGFAIILIHMNLTGKTQLSQMTPVDFVGNFVLGGVMGGVIYNETIPMFQYVSVLVIGITFIGILNSLTKRVSAVRSMAMGKPIMVIKNGKLMIDEIESNKARVDLVNFASQIHTRGIKTIQQIDYARIEPSGQLTIFCDKKDMPSLLLVADGRIVDINLQEISKNSEWMELKMKAANVELKDVFIGEYWSENITFVLRDGSKREQEACDVS